MKPMKHRIAFSQRLIFSFAIIMIFALSFSAVFGYVSASKTVERMLEYTMNKVLNTVRSRMEDYISDLEQITLAPTYSQEIRNVLQGLKFKQNIERADAEAELFKTFDLLIGIRSDLLGIYIFDDLDNRYYKTSLGDITPLYSFYKQPWYRITKDLNGEPLLITTHKTDYFVTQLPKYAISMSRAIIDQSNERIGLICVDFDLEPIKENAKGISELDESELYILDQDNCIIYCDDERKYGEKFEMFDLALLPTEQGSRKIEITGINYLITSQHSEKYGLQYITVSNIDKLLLSNLNMVRLYIVFMTCALLGVFLVLSAFLTNRMSRPINMLMRAMNETDGQTFKLVSKTKAPDDIGILINTYNNMAMRIDKLINDVLLAELARREARFGALQSQINPHFFYNTLNSISCIAQIRGVEEISELCGAMSGLYRYSTDFQYQLVTLEQELDCVNKFMLIQKVRYGEKLSCRIDIPENVREALTIKLSLQPIVENAIYHGIEPKKGGGDVSIRAWIEADTLFISVQDNGIGISEETLAAIQHNLSGSYGAPTDKSEAALTSIGIVNVHERIRLKFGASYGIKITSSPKTGTTVLLRLPYLEREDSYELSDSR